MIDSKYFLKVKEILESNNPDIRLYIFPGMISFEDIEFNRFLENTLVKYINSYKACQWIGRKFIQNVSMASYYEEQFLTQLYSLLKNSELSNNFKYFLLMERKAIMSQILLEKCQKSIQKCKYLTFREQYKQLDKKIQRMSLALNVYQSFIISSASQQSYQLLSGQQLNAYNFYKEYRYNLNEEIIPAFFTLQRYKLQSIKIDQIIITASKYQPYLNQHYDRQWKLQNINKFIIKYGSQTQEIIQLFRTYINDLKEQKQLKSPFQFFPNANNQICRLISKFIIQINDLKRQLQKHIRQKANNQKIFPSYNLLTYRILTPYMQLPQQTKSINFKYYESSTQQYLIKKQKQQILQATNFSLTDQIKKNMQFINSVTNLFDQYQRKIKFQAEIINFDQNLEKKLMQFRQILQFISKSGPQLLIVPPQNQNQSFIDPCQLLNQSKVQQKKFESFRNNLISNQVQNIQSYISQSNQSERQIDYRRQLQLNYQALKIKQAQIKRLTTQLQKKQLKITELQRLNVEKMSNQVYLQANKVILQEKKYQNYKQIEIMTQIHMNDIESIFNRFNMLSEQLHQTKIQLESCKKQNYHNLQQKCQLRSRYEEQQQKRVIDFRQQDEIHKKQILNLQLKLNQKNEQRINQITIEYNAKIDQLNKRDLHNRQLYENLKIKYNEQINQRYDKSMSMISQIHNGIISSGIRNNQIQNQNQIRIINEMNQAKIQELNRLHTQRKNQLQLEIMQFKNQNCKLNSEILLLYSEIDKLKDQIKEKSKECQSIKKNYQNLQVKLEEQTKLTIEKSKTISSLQTTIADLQRNIARLSVSLVLNTQEDQSNQQNQIPSNLARFVYYTKPLFNEDIFLEDEKSKKILVSHIQRYTRSRITRTALLHKYDTRNKTNFHQYIDNIKGLAIVVKTSSAIFAGYYPSIFRDKQILDKGGLLISVTNDDSFFLYKKKPGDNSKVIYRGMIYDTFFALFGNAQIRVKSGIKTVFSNFGVSNGYFDPRGHRIDRLFNQGQTRQMQFQYCEFYQVFLERQNQII